MKHIIFIATILLTITTLAIRADLLDCKESTTLSIADFPLIGPKVASREETSAETHEVRDFFKKVGCQLKKGAGTVKEHAKQLGHNLKEGAKKLGEKAKDLGSDIKVKFHQFQDKLSRDSSDERKSDDILSNVEIINPDILRAEQQCGHGHILDALGNCSKLR